MDTKDIFTGYKSMKWKAQLWGYFVLLSEALISSQRHPFPAFQNIPKSTVK